MSVTVIIPAFNAEAFVERTLLSALGQTYTDLEVLVIDDGSTDSTVAIVKRIANDWPNLRCISTAHRGVSSARNTGIKEATGDFVAFLDADDLWHPTKIAKQFAAISNHGGDRQWAACYSQFRLIDDEDRLIRSSPIRNCRGYIWASHMVLNHIGNGSNLMVSRRAARSIGGFDTSLDHSEDRDFQLRLFRQCKIELVPEFLVGYRCHEFRATNQQVKMAKSLIEVAKKHSSDPLVPTWLRRATLAAAYKYAWPKLLKGGAYSSSCVTLSMFFASAPVSCSIDVLVRATRLVKRSKPQFGNPAPRFHTIDPTCLSDSHSISRESRLVRRIKAYDQKLSEVISTDWRNYE